MSFSDRFHSSTRKPRLLWAVSGRQRNKRSWITSGGQRSQGLRGRSLTSCSTQARFAAECTSRSAPSEVLAQQAADVLVAPALPRAGQQGEEDTVAENLGDGGVLGHLRTLVPGQRAAHRGWQERHRGRHGWTHVPGRVVDRQMHELDVASQIPAQRATMRQVQAGRSSRG